MKPSRSTPRSLRLAIRACYLALLATGLLAPGSASAAHCGRYVEANARFEQDLARLLTDDDREGSDGLAPLPVVPPPPCSGVLCSRFPATPAPPVAVPAPGGEFWIVPIDVAAIPSLDSLSLIFDEVVLRPVHSGLAVFHPPRIALPLG